MKNKMKIAAVSKLVVYWLMGIMGFEIFLGVIDVLLYEFDVDLNISHSLFRIQLISWLLLALSFVFALVMNKYSDHE